jgi:hypothetical protein
MPYNHKNRSAERMTEAICPRCDKRHRMKIFWSGVGTPRKFCAGCLPEVSKRMSGLDDGSAFNRYAAVVRISTRP